jgi:hypothetical protein
MERDTREAGGHLLLAVVAPCALGAQLERSAPAALAAATHGGARRRSRPLLRMEVTRGSAWSVHPRRYLAAASCCSPWRRSGRPPAAVLGGDFPAVVLAGSLVLLHMAVLGGVHPRRSSAATSPRRCSTTASCCSTWRCSGRHPVLGGGLVLRPLAVLGASTSGGARRRPPRGGARRRLHAAPMVVMG